MIVHSALPFVATQEQAVSPDFCQRVLEIAEDHGWQEPSEGRGVRANDGAQFSSFVDSEIREALLRVAKQVVPQATSVGRTLFVQRYCPGAGFPAHSDGSQNRSHYTLLVFLSEVVGGEVFFSHKYRIPTIAPLPGKALLFYRRGIKHGARPPVLGDKFVLRADIRQ